MKIVAKSVFMKRYISALFIIKKNTFEGIIHYSLLRFRQTLPQHIPNFPFTINFCQVKIIHSPGRH